MDPLEVLNAEHALIRQYLDKLAYATEKLERGEQPPKEFFDKAVQFARTFVDKHHHFKEEHVMFTWLAQQKTGVFDGPVDALRYQHERSRQRISQISESLAGYAEGEEEKVTVLLENLASYISMLRQHIHREDHFFYPLVRKQLSESESRIMLEEFEKADRKAGKDFLEQSRNLVLSMGSSL